MANLIEFLAWDSNFFGRRVGKLNLHSAATLDNSIQAAYQQGYELLYVYSSFPIAYSSVGRYSLLDVGGHVTFVKSLSGHSPEEAMTVKEISQYLLEAPTPELLQLAFLSGHLSRFKIDTSLPPGSFESLYKAWLTNSLIYKQKSALYTYHCDEKLAGIITSEISGTKCTIGLLAVSDIFQGKGIATSLIAHIIRMCSQNLVSSVEVKTQLVNSSARALYLKNTFVERERSFLYHAHIVG
jgi:dTDP-4-amino-4,6-dideoxy-D-galactose acyltransferase